MVEEEGGGERAALGETHYAVVGAVFGDVGEKPFMCLSYGFKVEFHKGVIRGRVEEVNAGSGGAGIGCIDEVELELILVEEFAERSCSIITLENIFLRGRGKIPDCDWNIWALVPLPCKQRNRILPLPFRTQRIDYAIDQPMETKLSHR